MIESAGSISGVQPIRRASQTAEASMRHGHHSRISNLLRIGISVAIAIILGAGLQSQTQKQPAPPASQRYPVATPASQKQIENIKSQLSTLQDKLASLEATASDTLNRRLGRSVFAHMACAADGCAADRVVSSSPTERDSLRLCGDLKTLQPRVTSENRISPPPAGLP